MNYLAHLYLSQETPQAMVGAVLGDYVKGAVHSRYDGNIRQAIVLHRKIDTYTDAHKRVLDSKKLFSASRRRYAGVLLDLFFDHFLARHWRQYSRQGLSEFTQSAYQALQMHEPLLPSAMCLMTQAMRHQDWLGAYATEQGIANATNGLARRYPRHHRLQGGAEELLRNYHELESLFQSFFPELITFVEQHKSPAVSPVVNVG